MNPKRISEKSVRERHVCKRQHRGPSGACQRRSKVFCLGLGEIAGRHCQTNRGGVAGQIEVESNRHGKWWWPRGHKPDPKLLIIRGISRKESYANGARMQAGIFQPARTMPGRWPPHSEGQSPEERGDGPEQRTVKTFGMSPSAPCLRCAPSANGHRPSWPGRRRRNGPTSAKRWGCPRRIQCNASQTGAASRDG